MENVTLAWSVGIIGIAGTILGAFFAFKNTNRSREKRFVIKVTFAAWVLISIYLVCSFLIPAAYKPFLHLFYATSLAAAIIWGNKHISKIRQSEH